LSPIWILFLVSLFSFSRIGCTYFPEEPSPIVGNVSVIAVLSTEARTQKIYIYSVTSLGDERNPDELFVKDAIVMVNGVSFLHTIEAQSWQKNSYALEFPGFVHPDSTYSLYVQYSDKTILGTTRVPGQFSITNLPKISEYKLKPTNNTIVIQWSASRNARGYLLNVKAPPIEYPPGSGRFIPGGFNRWITRDTLAAIDVGSVGNHTIKVGAFDEHYERHFLRGFQVAGLQNAYGVFASMVVDSLVIRVRE